MAVDDYVPWPEGAGGVGETVRHGGHINDALTVFVGNYVLQSKETDSNVVGN